MYIDLRHAMLDEFIAFVFDHPVVVREYTPDADGMIRYDPDAPKEWYWEEELTVDLDPSRQVALLTELFRGAATLCWRFSPEQLDQGFWFVFGAGGEDYFTRFLAEGVVDWPAREACIEAIYNLYAELFAHEWVESAAFMLWDILLDRLRSLDDGATVCVLPPERHVADAMFRTLRRILALPVAECQHAALHGLGHLRHPATASAVQEFLDSRPSLDPELRQYAEWVLEGEEIL